MIAGRPTSYRLFIFIFTFSLFQVDGPTADCSLHISESSLDETVWLYNSVCLQRQRHLLGIARSIELD